MADYKIAKGFDVRLDGKPALHIADCPDCGLAVVYPREFTGVKQRLKVKEGDAVKRGTELLEDKRNERFKVCSPAGGTVKAIVRGERRFVDKIIIEIAAQEDAEQFNKCPPDEIRGLSAEQIMDQLLRAGYIAFIRQRPFSGIADWNLRPKRIFVNAMNTAPFQASADVVVEDDPAAFQAGLDLLTRLTDGPVHLCAPPDAGAGLKSSRNVTLHTFIGPHPSGNTSVHISRIAPMEPADIIWTVKAVDLVLVGRLFLDGALPRTRIMSFGGPSIKEEGRKHWRLRMGGSLEPLLSKYVLEGEHRLINGDVLSGVKIEPNGHLRSGQSSLTVIPEGRERRFLGWLAPGIRSPSFSPAFVSSWLGGKRPWRLNTNKNGGRRAMVLTGYYDRVMPLNIMVDYLVRAVLAGDTDEAIRLGILETDPEDFALCDFICPSKMEMQSIIQKGLRDIEAEGV